VIYGKLLIIVYYNTELMHIAVISSSIYPANPKQYGSEWLNSVLASYLAKLGHDVTLYAPPGSIVKYGAKLRYIPLSFTQVSIPHEARIYEMYKDELLEYDYIIDASSTCRLAERMYFWHRDEMPFTVFFRNGFGNLDFPRPPVSRELVGVFLSKAAAKEAEKWIGTKHKLTYIYYGLPLEDYQPCYDKANYFLYFSRFHKDKGIFTAIKLAKKLGFKLICAGSTLAKDHKKYYEEARRMASGCKNIIFVPNPTNEQKIELMRRAKALLVPLSPEYKEAFGLVFVEALLLGTPVITLDRPSAPEILSKEVAFICKDMKELEKACREVDTIDLRKCRKFAEQRYNAERMAKDYLALFDKYAT